MICDFTSFLTVFQSYQRLEFDNERLCAMELRLRPERFPPPAGLEPGTARSVGQRLTS